MAPDRILVTGGVGFIGSHLCETLLRRGYAVTCYDILRADLVNPATLDRFAGFSRFTFVEDDILNSERLRASMTGHDAVIHSAAVSSVDRSLRSPGEAITVNVTGTLNVLEAARDVGVPRVHYVSTDEVWGQISHGHFHEDSPTRPRNPYAAGKAGGEAIALAWGSTYGINVTITNACNTYGPYQKPDKLIARSIVRLLRGDRPTIYGDGKHIREWIHVEDHAAAILAVLEEGERGERYCVGSGERFSTLDVVRSILAHFGAVDDRVEFMDDRVSNDRRYALDSAALQKLGWRPGLEFDEGLTKTVEWYTQNERWWKYFADV
jgi:dTDP-glucose 4,6-dehydratase